MKKGKMGAPVRVSKNSTTPIGDLLKTIRATQKLALKDLSEKLSVSVPFISNIEQGKAPLPWDKIKPLSIISGIPVQYIADTTLKSTFAYKEYLKLVEESSV